MKTCWMVVLRCAMRTGCILALLCSAYPAVALGGGTQTAIVHAMRNVSCTGDQGSSAEIYYYPHAIPEDPAMCIEYELRTGKVSYFIHPRRAILLQVGGEVVIRLAGNELLLRTSGAAKEIRCEVLAMTLRSEQEQKEKDWEWERRTQPRRDFLRGCYTEAGIEISCEEEEARRY